jgi:excisionase family DNA binding protein
VSNLSTGLSREERGTGGGTGALPSWADPVHTVKEVAKFLSIGEPTLRTMIREGRGPITIKLGLRRVGIRESALRQWLDSRAVIVPAE